MPIITETTSLGGATIHVDHDEENYYVDLRPDPLTAGESVELNAILAKHHLIPLDEEECPSEYAKDTLDLRFWCFRAEEAA